MLTACVVQVQVQVQNAFANMPMPKIYLPHEPVLTTAYRNNTAYPYTTCKVDT